MRGAQMAPASFVDLTELNNDTMAQLPLGKVIKVKEQDKLVMTLEWRDSRYVHLPGVSVRGPRHSPGRFLYERPGPVVIFLATKKKPRPGDGDAPQTD